MFLCFVTSLPRSPGKTLPVSVHWTFGGRLLDTDSQNEGQGRYMSKASENRHVLVITKVRAEDEGDYACAVSVGDKTDRAVRRLVVQSKPSSL